MFRIAADLQAELKFSNNERINLEMSLLDMIAVKKSPSISSIISRLEGVAPAAGRRQKDERGAGPGGNIRGGRCRAAPRG